MKLYLLTLAISAGDFLGVAQDRRENLAQVSAAVVNKAGFVREHLEFDPLRAVEDHAVHAVIEQPKNLPPVESRPVQKLGNAPDEFSGGLAAQRAPVNPAVDEDRRCGCQQMAADLRKQLRYHSGLLVSILFLLYLNFLRTRRVS